MKKALFLLSAVGAVLILGGCDMRSVRPSDAHVAFNGERGKLYNLEVTGYCPCGECCGWRRNFLLLPVYSSGPLRGQRKDVGVTATGTRARPGTIAADPTVFPFGTILYVPEYGYGRVEDCGSDIRGYHIDLFFRSHRDARQWGHVRRRVNVWFPPGYRGSNPKTVRIR